MFGYKHYVAVLRWRQGEMDALRDLYDQDRKHITPLIEILPLNGGGFSKIIKDIAQKWGFEPFFLDLGRLSPTLRLAGGGHPFELIGKEAKSLPIKLIPVTGFGRDTDYRAAVNSVLKNNQQGMCIRVLRNDLARASFATELLTLASQHKSDPKDTDLIVDLEGSIENVDYARICQLIPKLREWRTFTVLSGAFLKDLSDIDKNTEYQLERADWLSWRRNLAGGQKLPRKPAFGDYTIQYPYFEPPEGIPNPTASIRYTAADYWLIMRGQALRGDGPGYAQYPAEAQQLRGRSEFCGSDYSAGDKYITNVNPKQTGNTTTWISAGINHHLTFTARQVASLS